MCGGISSSLAISLATGRGSQGQLGVVLIAQGGKALAYAAAGAVLGALGAGLYGAFDRQGGHLVLQWLGALALAWVGLSTLGVVPAMASFDRALAPLRRRLWSARGRGRLAALAAGLVWGLLPCGMVYAALAFAMLAGSALGGAAAMLGFGLGTMPAVTAVALGIGRLPRGAGAPIARLSVGAGLIVAGIASLIWPMGGLAALCKP
jgi:hypothetical protein